jgi:hypothetical protein
LGKKAQNNKLIRFKKLKISVLRRMWLVYVAIFVILIFILDDFLLDKRQFELYKNFASPPRLPLIGHAYIALFLKPKGECRRGC